MSEILPYLSIPIAYLWGSIPFGLLLGWLAGKDVRKEGSGNIGATNVLRTCGWAFGVPAFLMDFLKGYGPALLAIHVFEAEPLVVVAAAICAVLGHNFPVWLGFRGGKGVATSAGAVLALIPIPLAIGGGVFLLCVALTRYVSLGSMLGTLGMVVAHLLLAAAPFSRDGLPVTAMAAAMLLLVLLRHRANVGRLLAGTESKFGRSRDDDGPS